eukprot:m.83649 g.83649  ORF g.83649 m.83649 type:complete len:470 (-) comp8310_c0_seq1:189-1598(-)
MDKYEVLGTIGEGSYGKVFKARHVTSRRIVAIKRFVDSEEDATVRKIALREVQLLKLLRHDHIVTLLEIFRRRRRLHMVFEFVDRSLLDEIQTSEYGLGLHRTRRYVWQILQGLSFCHLNNVVHRDIKPENVLVSSAGIVKLCDFGFARVTSEGGEGHTDYVATRWYRSPELLLAETTYGKDVDIWAIGCLVPEMLKGNPLFCGSSDIDQLRLIAESIGPLSSKHLQTFEGSSLFKGCKFPVPSSRPCLDILLHGIDPDMCELIKACLALDPSDRPTCEELLLHIVFRRDDFANKFTTELADMIAKASEQPVQREERKKRHHRKQRISEFTIEEEPHEPSSYSPPLPEPFQPAADPTITFSPRSSTSTSYSGSLSPASSRKTSVTAPLWSTLAPPTTTGWASPQTSTPSSPATSPRASVSLSPIVSPHKAASGARTPQDSLVVLPKIQASSPSMPRRSQQIFAAFPALG